MVSGFSQHTVATGEEGAVIEFEEHCAQYIKLLLQYGIYFVSINGRAATALACRVLFEGLLEVVGNADIVDHQAALLVAEDAVDPCNRLHQVVPLHRLVDVYGMDARSIKAGEPHIPDNNELHRIIRVFEAFFEAFFDLA